MPIKRETPTREIQDYINQRIVNLEYALVRSLCYVGEMCRNEAIQKHKYKNQSGNLESSTGYVVSIDGKVAQLGGFNTVLKGGKGSIEGQRFAKSLAKQEKKGVCLILVAGKNYAKYVSDKGLDVLDSAELLAEKMIPILMNQLNF